MTDYKQAYFNLKGDYDQLKAEFDEFRETSTILEAELDKELESLM